MLSVACLRIQPSFGRDNEAVELEIYYRGAEAGHPLILTPAEKADLLEFLKSLNSPVRAQFAGG